MSHFLLVCLPVVVLALNRRSALCIAEDAAWCLDTHVGEEAGANRQCSTISRQPMTQSVQDGAEIFYILLRQFSLRFGLSDLQILRHVVALVSEADVAWLTWIILYEADSGYLQIQSTILAIHNDLTHEVFEYLVHGLGLRVLTAHHGDAAKVDHSAILGIHKIVLLVAFSRLIFHLELAR